MEPVFSKQFFCVNEVEWPDKLASVFFSFCLSNDIPISNCDHQNFSFVFDNEMALEAEKRRCLQFSSTGARVLEATCTAKECTMTRSTIFTTSWRIVAPPENVKVKWILGPVTLTHKSTTCQIILRPLSPLGLLV